jgi:hypothetical protein
METTRNIQTVYYLNGKVVKVNYASHRNSAVLRCIDHLQLNHYGATVAEIIDTRTHVLQNVIRRYVGTDEIKIVYKCEVEGAAK